MKINKILATGMLSFAILFSGCTSVKSDNSTKESKSTATTEQSPNALQRQGLAFSRIMLSPVNMLGFTCAECKNMGSASVILFPFICCWSLPAGALSMSADVVTGCFEMLFWQQFTSVKYPWDSFEPEVAKPWCDTTKAMLLAFLAGAAEGAADGALNAATGNSGSSSSSYSSSKSSYKSKPRYKSRPRVRHSSCGGTGICNICRGRGRVGTLKCSGCGGSRRCRPCSGTGYAN